MKSGNIRTILADRAQSLLAKKPFKVVAVALVNKMARNAWAIMATSWTYDPRSN
jgi:transposase